MAILRWYDPFKADVVIATLPFISSGLWDSTINNLMTHCFWERDSWSHRHTLTHTPKYLHELWWCETIFDTPLLFFFSHYRFYGELIKTVNITRNAPSRLSHKHTLSLALLQPLSFSRVKTDALSQWNSDHDSLLILVRFPWKQETDHAHWGLVSEHKQRKTLKICTSQTYMSWHSTVTDRGV